MKALVLTFDKYRPFAEHMIMCYDVLWPNNPFTFRIPYQSEEIREFYVQKFGNKVEMIKSPSGIVDTMFALSDDLDENEWVYWCMDDRYLIKPNLKEMEKALNFTQSCEAARVDGICINNSPVCWISKHKFSRKYSFKTHEGQLYHRRKDYFMIWNHQYLRVKVVRDFFSLFPREMKQAKEMDYIKDSYLLPNSQKLYFLDKNAAVYGESTNRGMITLNTIESFKSKGLKVPEGFSVTNKALLKGATTRLDVAWFFIKRFVKSCIKRGGTNA